jgi:hypothetical protein
MSGTLTYDLRNATLTGILSGRLIRVPTLQVQAITAAWQREQGYRPGKAAFTDYGFELPGRQGAGTIPSAVAAGSIGHKLKFADAAALEIYDYPGETSGRSRFPDLPPPPPTPPNPIPIPYPNIAGLGPAVFVRNAKGGFLIHGGPDRGLGRCIVVMQQWEVLFRALAMETRVSVFLEY